MFNILTIDNQNKRLALTQNKGEPTAKKTKPNPTSTVSRPPPTDNDDQTNKNQNFLDFVPIENNKDDFHIADILQEIEKENANYQNIQTNNSAIAPVTDQIPKINTENAQVPATQTVTNVSNNSHMQNYPIIPHMIFPHSNVTINYNFQK